VIPRDQPVVDLEVAGDEIVGAVPEGILAGRGEIEVRRTRDGAGDIAITSALSVDQRAALESGRLLYDSIRETFIGGSTGIRDERRQVQFETPGTYAFIVWNGEQGPDPSGNAAVLDSQAFDVVAPSPGDSVAPSDGGQPAAVGAAIGVLTGSWAAAGSVLSARRRRWMELGRPTRRDLAIAATVGVGAGVLLGAFALLAVDLARNPF
jgi:hypothetical protein